MKRKKSRIRLCIVITVCCAILVFLVYLIAGIIPPTVPDYTDIEILYESSDRKEEFDSWINILLNGSEAICNSTNVSTKDGNITIHTAGVYRLCGELTDGSIYVAANDGIVYLLLDNASVTCKTSPAVYISAADKVVLVTVENTENNLVSTVSGGLESAVYSDTDITFNGRGKLNISSENGIAVNCNTSVKFIDGEYSIKAKENAVKTAYNFSMCGGNVNIHSGSDAVKTLSGGKLSGKWIGVAEITGGVLNIESDGDGINSTSVIHIGSGEVNITCGSGSVEAEASSGFGANMPKQGEMGSVNQVEEEQINAKGLKADTGIYLNGGNIYIDCADDAIHSDGDVTVDSGKLHILSNGDGIQGEKTVNILNGNVCIERSEEGISGRYITFSGGFVDIIATDDGVNATNNDNPIAALGMEIEILGTGGKLFIIGGTLHISASGDGLDSNGSINQSGGYVTVISESSGAEVPIDYTGTYNMTGGTLIAFGNGGNMMQSVSEKSSTVSSVKLGTDIQAGNIIKFIDSEQNELFSILSDVNCECLIVASDMFSNGTTVTAYVNEFEIGSAMLTEGSATIGTVSDGMMGGRPDNMQGAQNYDGQISPNIQGGQTPPDVKEGMQNNIRPDDMQNGNMNGGMIGMRRPFKFAIPIVLFIFIGLSITVFIVVRKKKKGEKDAEEDEDDLS